MTPALSDKLLIGTAQFKGEILQIFPNCIRALFCKGQAPPAASHDLRISTMRGKRSKQYRKLMQQYGLSFGFREPYQVLRKLSPTCQVCARNILISLCRSGRRHYQRFRQVQDGSDWGLRTNTSWTSQAKYALYTLAGSNKELITHSGHPMLNATSVCSSQRTRRILPHR
jgi:hypothetical protein